MRATKPLRSPLRDVNERRSHPRKGCRVLVNYEVAGKPYVGYVIDIGPGGLCLETCRAHHVGDAFALSFTLPRQERPLNVRGKAVSIQPKDPRRWWVGIQFEELAPEARQGVADYLLN
jgi:Tfp pilus assembly protein PilZ